MDDRKTALDLIEELITLKKRQAEIALAQKQARQRHLRQQAERFEAVPTNSEPTEYAASLQNELHYYILQQARAQEAKVKARQLEPEILAAKNHLSDCFKQEVAISELQKKVRYRQLTERELVEEASVEALIVHQPREA